jgi:hypothetical protein
MTRSKGWFTVNKDDLQKSLNLFEPELQAARIDDITLELKRRGFSFIQLRLNDITEKAKNVNNNIMVDNDISSTTTTSGGGKNDLLLVLL